MFAGSDQWIWSLMQPIRRTVAAIGPSIRRLKPLVGWDLPPSILLFSKQRPPVSTVVSVIVGFQPAGFDLSGSNAGRHTCAVLSGTASRYGATVKVSYMLCIHSEAIERFFFSLQLHGEWWIGRETENAIVVCFKSALLFHNLHGETEEKHQSLQKCCLVSGPRFETETSWIRTGEILTVRPQFSLVCS
jgi:hypothetical protein